jgi:glyoxylate reductase
MVRQPDEDHMLVPKDREAVTPKTAASLRRRAFLSRQLPEAVENKIAQRYELVRNPANRVLSGDELAWAARGCHYIFVSAMENVPRVVFEQLAGTLQAVATMSVGFNHIDLDAAREFGVAVFYSPGVLSDACAELAVMLLLNAARRGSEADQLVRSGKWTGYAPTQLLGIGLSGRRAGILGMGRIGQAVATRLKPFGVELHYHNRQRLPQQQERGATYHDSPESLLGVSDFLLICTPGSPELENFLNRERIALLPPRAIVVNISRGDTIDDNALIEALQSGRLFAAGLDVFANEPRVDTRYLTLPNVFLSPHIASATVDTRGAMGFILLDGLAAWEQGLTLENRLC